MNARQRWLVGLAGAVVVLAGGVIVLLTRGGGSEVKPTIVHEPPASSGQPAKPPQAAEQFGADVNGLYNYNRYSPAALSSQLSQLAGTGATIARTDALWEASEPDPPTNGIHHYEWSFDDQIVGSLAAHGLQWLPILDYSVSWARSVPGQDHSAPRDPAAFAAWGAALAARYGPGGSFWREHPTLHARPVDTIEVWNEPDNRPFWVPRPDANVYADLYLRSRNAITHADPSTRVIVGGLVNPGKFLREMLRARPDLARHIDGISTHPYGLDPAHVLHRMRAERRAIDSLGLGSVPLYVTEFGWATRPVGVAAYAPAAARPGFINATVRALGHTDCGIAAALIYTWVTPEHNPDDREDWFGIASPDGHPTADVAAFADGIRSATVPAPTQRFCGG